MEGKTKSSELRIVNACLLYLMVSVPCDCVLDRFVLVFEFSSLTMYKRVEGLPTFGYTAKNLRTSSCRREQTENKTKTK